jgi:hypothetical protein
MSRNTSSKSRRTRHMATAIAAASALALAAVAIPGAMASAAPPSARAASASASAPASAASALPKLTNLDHLDFLLDGVPLLPGVTNHTTFNASSEPTAQAPWVYANAEADGTFQRVGGGDITNAAKGYYAQGAFDADDISRSAVVYLTDWQQNHTPSSEQHAYELLRELTYLQDSSGPDAGNVVLWQQSDGTLNPSAIPVDIPNPSDSNDSFWVARTIWALGIGYSEFKTVNPSFASFLKARMDLSIAALDRESLSSYPKSVESNGAMVPSWLIGGSAGASAEAMLGMAAFVKADPSDRAVQTALRESATGVAAMSSGGVGAWPFGAILPETDAQTFWHAWAGLAPAALTEAASALREPSLERAAVTATAQFTAQLLASGGPDNGLTPTPSDTSQIAYGTDSLVESLLDTADATHNQGLDALAAVAAGWYFGANPANTPVYNAASGVCVDGISATGEVNTNCGAESTIHTELSMLALDAHPAVKAIALGLTSKTAVAGMSVAEAESGTLTGSASVATPTSVWTGSANWSNGEYVQAASGSTDAFPIPALTGPANIYPIVNRGIAPAGTTSWTASNGQSSTVLGTTQNGGVGPQGIAPTATELKPLSLSAAAPTGTTTITASVTGTAQLDAILIQPVVSHVGMTGSRGSYDLYVNGSSRSLIEPIAAAGHAVLVSSYDSSGRLVWTRVLRGAARSIPVAAGGFTTVQAS